MWLVPWTHQSWCYMPLNQLDPELRCWIWHVGEGRSWACPSQMLCVVHVLDPVHRASVVWHVGQFKTQVQHWELDDVVLWARFLTPLP